MAFLCVQCNERFESNEDKPRCPKCMRVHGIQRLDEPDPAAGKRATRIGAIAAAVLVVGGLGLAAFLRTRQSNGSSASEAADALTHKGVAAAELAALFEPDAAITALGRQAQGADPGARARAVVAAVRARAAKQAFVPWSMADPRDGAPMMAAQAWAAMAKDGARHHLYPLEVSAVVVAALRSAGVEASLAEIHGYSGEEAPLDPSGCLGYYGVAVGGAESPIVLDPYAGRERSPEQGAWTVLSDEQGVAAMLGIRALHSVSWAGEPASALKDIEAALGLWPNSPSLRSVRAVVLSDGGGVQEGEAALAAALSMRPDAPRHNNMAVYQLQRGDVSGAAQSVAKALELAPEYAAARVVLAGVHMAQHEDDLARAQLVQAESLDPELPTLSLAWAQYFASQGDFGEAVARAEQGAKLRPKQPHLQLNLGRLYRAAGRYDDMRRAAQAALALTPSTRQAEMRKLIEMLLGSTALEAPDDGQTGSQQSGSDATPTPSASGDDAVPTLPGLGDGALDVSRGSRLLSGRPASGGLQPRIAAPKLDLGGSKLDQEGGLDP